MVQYIVKAKESPIPQWRIIELQGEIELRNDKETDGFNSKYFGDIHFQQNGDPVLIIGHHTMTGKVVKLDKPYGVLARDPEKNFDVKALIKEKIIFKTRPKPIITHVPNRL